MRKTLRVQAPEPWRVPELWALPTRAGVCVRVSMKLGFIALFPSQRYKPQLHPGVSVSVQSMFYLLAGCCTFCLHACPCGSALVIVELFFFIYLSIFGWTGVLPS